jgi:hypothetical protein
MLILAKEHVLTIGRALELALSRRQAGRVENVLVQAGNQF